MYLLDCTSLLLIIMVYYEDDYNIMLHVFNLEISPLFREPIYKIYMYVKLLYYI